MLWSYDYLLCIRMKNIGAVLYSFITCYKKLRSADRGLISNLHYFVPNYKGTCQTRLTQIVFCQKEKRLGTNMLGFHLVLGMF